MKRQISTITLSLSLMASFMGLAQQPVQPCNTYAAMEEYFAVNPDAKKNYEKAQEQLKTSAAKLISNNEQMMSAPPVYTIPVVFHILHEGGSENISDQVCINALKGVNDDYAKLGSDANTIAAPFQPLFIDSEIRFMLAKKDPNGNCTNGIVHHYDSRTNWNQGAWNTNYNGITWNPTKYLNIIVVKQIIPTGTVTGGGIIVGYTYKPGSWSSNAPQDAIVYNYSYLTGMINLRSLSHEIGHWFNLPHTFGNTNNPGVTCGDDGISDTPPTKGAFSTCPSSLSGNVCDASGQDNVENIMNYSSCPKNFTSGQTTVMRNAAASPISGRNNLWSTGNLTATDVNGTATCAPVAEFLCTTGTYTVCSGGTLTFKDYSYNGTITSYAWTADNGATIAAPSASMSAITFPTPGITTITLTVANAQGNSTKVRTVQVLNGAPGITMPYSEGFEAGVLPTNWSINNLNPGSVTWDIVNGVSNGTGSKCYWLDGTQATAGQTDMLITPVMDLLNHATDTFTFKFAYARKSSTHNDVFKVEASKDCGGSWYTLYSPSASNMANGSGGVTSTPFTPFLSQWKHVKLNDWPNWNTVSNGASVIFRFTFQEDPNNSNGNNFYLDDINFSGSANGLNELSKLYQFNLFPNPSKGEAIVKFNLHDAATVKIEVVDVLGKKVLPSADLNLAPGEQTYSINKNGSLTKGIYFVNLSVNGAKMTKKLIVE